MTSLYVRCSPEWCRAYLGKAFDDLLPENRCALCERSVKGKLRHDCDPKLERMGLPIEACHRGWVCDGCESLLKWIYRIGEEKVFAYWNRFVAIGDPPPTYPKDGSCELCKKATGRKLHHDHDHELEAMGVSLFDSQRGFLCDGCNTSKLARMDRIGPKKLREYIVRARSRRKSAQGPTLPHELRRDD